MLGMTSYVELVDCLRLRFDSFSARAVLDEMLGHVGLPIKALYRPEEVETLASRLSDRRDRMERAVEALREVGRPARPSVP